MSEVRNMFKPNQEILQNLQNYIKENSSIDVWIGRKKIDTKNPIIIFEESRNELLSKSTTYDNTKRILNYSINIYCEKLKNSYEIVHELAVLVCELMQDYYHMDGGLIAVLPVFDETDKNGWQANLRFTVRFIPNRSKLY